MIFLNTKERFLFNLDFIAPTVLEKGAKKGKNQCFIKTMYMYNVVLFRF